MTITEIEQAIGNDRQMPLVLVLETGQQIRLVPGKFGTTGNGKRLFIPLEDDQFAIVETASVKTIIK